MPDTKFLKYSNGIFLELPGDRCHALTPDSAPALDSAGGGVYHPRSWRL
jgi:hypothetical protein